MPDSKPETHQTARQTIRGRTILITRAIAQSKELTSTLESRGARVLHCPTIEVIEPDSWHALDSAIERLDSYDWITFTSANGVAFFFQRLKAKSASYPADRVITFAIGPATATALRERNLRVTLTAEDSKAEGALTSIIHYAGSEEGLRGLKFLIPRARIARDYLPRQLARFGAHVDAVETYQTVKPDVDGKEIIKLFEEQIIDATTFTSSSTVSNFASIVGMDDLSQLLQRTLVACIGPVTAKTAAEYGLTRILQPDLYTTQALAQAIIDALGDK